MNIKSDSKSLPGKNTLVHCKNSQIVNKKVLKHFPQALCTNVILGWKGFVGENAPAYFALASVKKTFCRIIDIWGLFHKLFTTVSNGHSKISCNMINYKHLHIRRTLAFFLSGAIVIKLFLSMSYGFSY